MRDLIGYGEKGVALQWPNAARIAINFVLNYESGAERSPADGDDQSESYLTDLPGCTSRQGERHLSVESMFEYGSRCGIWRLHRIFDQHQVPITVFACGRALQRNLDYAKYLQDSQHEVAGHAYRWIDYHNIPIDVERQHIIQTLQLIKELTGKPASGWYTGRKSAVTQQLVAEHHLLYQSDTYADDLPYWLNFNGNTQLMIPYTLVTNDCRYTTSPGIACSKDFYHELKAAFDFQYAEAGQRTQLLTIALHERISGRPSRAQAIRDFLQYVQDKPRVWITTRAEIARFWHNQYPYKAV